MAKAYATPPDIVTVHDDLIAVNDKAFYVLRTVDDNTGSYYQIVSTVFLVETQWDDGKEQFWPISRSQLLLDDTHKPKVTIGSMHLEGAKELSQLLSEKKAISPGAYQSWMKKQFSLIQINKDNISLRVEGFKEFQVPTKKILQGVTQSQNHLASLIPPYQRLGPTKAGDFIRDIEFSSDACSVLEPTYLIDLTGDDDKVLVRLRCEDDEIETLSRIVYISPKQ